jgi:hypothetical protein
MYKTPLSKNRAVIASAGSGKTTYLVEEALRVCASSKVLITTYTNENVDQINLCLKRVKGYIPNNITVMPWYSFLLRDGVRPYQNFMTNGKRIESIDFQSPTPRYPKKASVDRYYLTKHRDIFKDRVADFIHTCNRKTTGLITKRIERIYAHIFIDEVQDLAGYDLDFLEELFSSKTAVFVVGDPRQGTFSTNNANKNKKFKRKNIKDWIDALKKNSLIEVTELTDCYRSNQQICDFADALFPTLPKAVSRNTNVTGHDGIFCVPPENVNDYVKNYAPVVLRLNKRFDTMGLPALNIGLTKGRTYDRVLIFPTDPMKKYLETLNPAKAGDLAKLYVAVTRARYSVGFVI